MFFKVVLLLILSFLSLAGKYLFVKLVLPYLPTGLIDLSILFWESFNEVLKPLFLSPLRPMLFVPMPDPSHQYPGFHPAWWPPLFRPEGSEEEIDIEAILKGFEEPVVAAIKVIDGLILFYGGPMAKTYIAAYILFGIIGYCLTAAFPGDPDPRKRWRGQKKGRKDGLDPDEKPWDELSPEEQQQAWRDFYRRSKWFRAPRRLGGPLGNENPVIPDDVYWRMATGVNEEEYQKAQQAIREAEQLWAAYKEHVKEEAKEEIHQELQESRSEFASTVGEAARRKALNEKPLGSNEIPHWLEGTFGFQPKPPTEEVPEDYLKETSVEEHFGPIPTSQIPPVSDIEDSDAEEDSEVTLQKYQKLLNPNPSQPSVEQSGEGSNLSTGPYEEEKEVLDPSRNPFHGDSRFRDYLLGRATPIDSYFNWLERTSGSTEPLPPESPPAELAEPASVEPTVSVGETWGGWFRRICGFGPSEAPSPESPPAESDDFSAEEEEPLGPELIESETWWEWFLRFCGFGPAEPPPPFYSQPIGPELPSNESADAYEANAPLRRISSQVSEYYHLTYMKRVERVLEFILPGETAIIDMSDFDPHTQLPRFDKHELDRSLLLRARATPPLSNPFEEQADEGEFSGFVDPREEQFIAKEPEPQIISEAEFRPLIYRGPGGMEPEYPHPAEQEYYQGLFGDRGLDMVMAKAKAESATPVIKRPTFSSLGFGEKPADYGTEYEYEPLDPTEFDRPIPRWGKQEDWEKTPPGFRKVPVSKPTE